jgi:hypothetical protein
MQGRRFADHLTAEGSGLGARCTGRIGASREFHPEPAQIPYFHGTHRFCAKSEADHPHDTT